MVNRINYKSELFIYFSIAVKFFNCRLCCVVYCGIILFLCCVQRGFGYPARLDQIKTNSKIGNQKPGTAYLPPIRSGFSFGVKAPDAVNHKIISSSREAVFNAYLRSTTTPPPTPANKKSAPAVSFGTSKTANAQIEGPHFKINKEPLLVTLPKQNPYIGRSSPYFDSYAAQPSGIGKPLPTLPSLPPLPLLVPKSVINLETTSANALKQEQNRITNAGEDAAQPKPATLITFENPAKVLAPSRNATIQAAQVLATSLLRATDADLENSDFGFQEINDSISKEELNKTEVVIVKMQKNAYIVPPTSDQKSPVSVQELFSMRDKLEKAYTVNQFLFIIRPQHINFVNKLV